MASSVIGALRVILGIDSAQFNKGLKGAQSGLQQFGKKMRNVGAGLSAGLTAPLVAMGKKSVDAFKVQEKALALVESGLKATGGTAGFTTEQFARMAAEMQKVSTFGDEDILENVTAGMLKFQSVAGETFQRAQTAILDFAAQTGTSLAGATQQIGRALEDPINGLTLLRRAGIVFTEQQTEMIKTMHAAGDVAGAQALILDALEGKFKGAAAAMAETTDGKFAQAWNAVGDAMEAVGAAIAPVLIPIANGIKSLAEGFSALSPETQQFVVIAGGLAAALGPVIAAIGLMALGIAAIGAPVALVIAGLVGLTAAVVAFWPEIVTAKDKVLEFAQAVGERLGEAWEAFIEMTDRAVEAVRLMAEGIAAKAALVWQSLVEMKDKAIEAVMALYEGVKTWLTDKLDAVWSTVTAGIEKVNNAFSWLKDQVVGNSHIPDMVVGVERWMGRLATSMPTLADQAASGTESRFSSMANTMGDIMKEVGSTIQSAFSSAIDGLLNGTFKAKEAIASLLKDLAKLFINRAFQMLFGGGGGGGGLGSLFAGFFAGGGTIPRGQFGIVGEAGPELVQGPADVTPVEMVSGDDGGPGGRGDMHVSVPVRNVNVFDPADMLERALGTRAGERVLLNFVNQNSGAMRGALGRAGA